MEYNQTIEYRSGNLSAVNIFKEYENESLMQFGLAICIIFVLIGIPGNLITIVALGTCKKFRNATAYYIINLHIINFIFCCTILPMIINTYATRHWVFGGTMCGVYALMKYSLNGAAHFTVVVITVNRYIMVCHPFIYTKICKKIYFILSMIFPWAAGVAFFLPSFFGIWGNFGLDIKNKGIDCTMISDKNGGNPKTFVISFAFIGVYSVICFCYFRIWWTVRKTMHLRNKRKMRTEPALSSNSNSNPTVVENGKIIRHQPTAYKSPTEEEITAISLTPEGSPNKIKTFFKASFRSIRKDNEVHLPTRKDKKLATMILAIMVSFAICHLPLLLARVSFDYKANSSVNILVHLLEYCTAVISPIVYVIMSNEYRQAYLSLFGNMKMTLMKYLTRK